MAIVRYTLDPANPPRLSAEALARLDAMTDEELTRNALEDPDNPPTTAEEFARGFAGRRIRLLRESTGLDHEEFAHRYRLPLQVLLDGEFGVRLPDEAFMAYIAVIEREREAVERALAAEEQADASRAAAIAAE